MADLSYYRGKRIFLTGHTGFKGGWLATWLKHLGAEVHGYSLQPAKEPSLFGTLDLERRMESTIGDINDLPDLQEDLSTFQPDIVFHMAAQPLVRWSYQHPLDTFRTNIMGTVNLLEAVRACERVRTCVVITSDKCYKNNEWVYAYRENDPMGGDDPYSASKGAAEVVAHSYRSSFFQGPLSRGRHRGIATARAGNVIGGGDWSPERIVPDTIGHLQRGEPIKLRNPQAIRPWQHVLEPLHGYLRLAIALDDEPTAFGSGFNFGPSRSDVTVSQLVEAIIRKWGSGEWLDVHDSNAPHEAQYLRLDSTKSNNLLGWTPELDIEEAIEMTVDWYKAHEEGEDMWDRTIAQIDLYQGRLRRLERSKVGSK